VEEERKGKNQTMARTGEEERPLYSRRVNPEELPGRRGFKATRLKHRLKKGGKIQSPHWVKGKTFTARWERKATVRPS